VLAFLSLSAPPDCSPLDPVPPRPAKAVVPPLVSLRRALSTWHFRDNHPFLSNSSPAGRRLYFIPPAVVFLFIFPPSLRRCSLGLSVFISTHRANPFFSSPPISRSIVIFLFAPFLDPLLRCLGLLIEDVSDLYLCDSAVSGRKVATYLFSPPPPLCLLFAAFFPVSLIRLGRYAPLPIS